MINTFEETVFILDFDKFKHIIDDFKIEFDSSIKNSELYPNIIRVNFVLNQIFEIKDVLNTYNDVLNLNKVMANSGIFPPYLVPLGNNHAPLILWVPYAQYGDAMSFLSKSQEDFSPYQDSFHALQTYARQDIFVSKTGLDITCHDQGIIIIPIKERGLSLYERRKFEGGMCQTHGVHIDIENRCDKTYLSLEHALKDSSSNVPIFIAFNTENFSLKATSLPVLVEKLNEIYIGRFGN